jgi:hypothetical protein
MKITTTLVLLFCLFAGCATPTGGEARGITWEEAVALFRYNAVEMAFQAHDLKVVLVTKDGKKYVVEELTVDAVLRLIEEVDPKRERIRYGTE